MEARPSHCVTAMLGAKRSGKGGEIRGRGRGDTERDQGRKRWEVERGGREGGERSGKWREEVEREATDISK